MLCFDVRYCSKVAALVADLRLDNRDPYVDILPLAVSYTKQYGKPIGSEILRQHLIHADRHPLPAAEQLIDGTVRRTEKRYNEFIKNWEDPGYLMRSAEFWANATRLGDALMEARESLDSATSHAELTEAFEKVRKAIPKDHAARKILSFNDPWTPTTQSIDRRFTSGLKTLDRESIIPQPGQLWLTIGLKGQGKSWRMLHSAVMNAMSGLKVLVFSLEMSTEEVRRRLIQMIGSYGSRTAKTYKILKLHDYPEGLPPQKCAPNTFYEITRPAIGDTTEYDEEFSHAHKRQSQEQIAAARIVRGYTMQLYRNTRGEIESFEPDHISDVCELAEYLRSKDGVHSLLYMRTNNGNDVAMPRPWTLRFQLDHRDAA